MVLLVSHHGMIVRSFIFHNLTVMLFVDISEYICGIYTYGFQNSVIKTANSIRPN